MNEEVFQKLSQLAKEEGFESTEEFVKYLIEAHHILKKLRGLLNIEEIKVKRPKTGAKPAFTVSYTGKIGAIIPVFYVDSKDPLYAEDPREADVRLNAEFANEHDFVYWDANIPWIVNLKKYVPTCIYFYEASLIGDGLKVVPGPRMVRWRAEVVDILTLDELKDNPNEIKYVPPWRYQCLHGIWPNNQYARAQRFVGKNHITTKYWLKLTNFEPIDPQPLEFFLKPNGQQFKSRRGGYILCPENSEELNDEDTVIINGKEYTLGDSPYCPACERIGRKRKYWCDEHRYIYRKWYQGYKQALTGES